MDKEIWKNIEGYEGLYQVSNLGRVKRLKKIFKKYNGYGIFNHYLDEKILKPTKEQYYRVSLIKNNKRQTFLVHRLVAQAFIPNPNNYPCVNHKDENKLNNNVNNLEWCDVKYNMNYGTIHKKFKMNNHNSKKVICLETKEIFQSGKQCAESIGCHRSNVGNCCNNKQATIKGNHYMWLDEYIKQRESKFANILADNLF